MASILLTGGIGDVFALESHWPRHLYAEPLTIYLATPRAAPIQSLLAARLGSLVRLRIVDCWLPCFGVPCFVSLGQVLYHYRHHGIEPPEGLADAVDWSIFVRFPEILKGQHQYHGSAWLAGVDPYRTCGHVVCCPESHTGITTKTLNEAERHAIAKYAEAANTIVFVLNDKPIDFPRSAYVHNLSGHTTLAESIEILAGASGYIGVDTCLSVLAAQLFDAERLLIKTHSANCVAHAAVYFAPHTNFTFLVKSFEAPTTYDYDHFLFTRLGYELDGNKH